MLNKNAETLILNLHGLSCPQPVLHSKRALRKLVKGTIIRIECTDPLTERDIPNMTKFLGHKMLDKGIDNIIFWYLIEIRD
ncbi:sulfurtransferase TusA family protein [Gluconobacter oxydans]|uniref:sulfurtransferase TusA family protein n=1 Tax=Gluconobacter oxydans TaxID=442 RepID=UPI0039EB2567